MSNILQAPETITMDRGQASEGLRYLEAWASFASSKSASVLVEGLDWNSEPKRRQARVQGADASRLRPESSHCLCFLSTVKSKDIH